MVSTFSGVLLRSPELFYYTGDTKPLSEVINPEEIISPELLRLYRENRGWLIANQDVYRVQVTIPGIGRRQRTAAISVNTRHGDLFAMRPSSTCPKRGRSYPSISS